MNVLSLISLYTSECRTKIGRSLVVSLLDASQAITAKVRFFEPSFKIDSDHLQTTFVINASDLVRVHDNFLFAVILSYVSPHFEMTDCVSNYYKTM